MALRVRVGMNVTTLFDKVVSSLPELSAVRIASSSLFFVAVGLRLIVLPFRLFFRHSSLLFFNTLRTIWTAAPNFYFGCDLFQAILFTLFFITLKDFTLSLVLPI